MLRENYKRNNVIDSIRGLSIISVLLLHINIQFHLDASIGKVIPQHIFNIIFRSGYYGVVIFFVISGFLITTSALKKWGNLQSINLFQFYQIRFARIGPCLIGLIALLSILHLFQVTGFIIKTTSLTEAIWSAFTFQINWLEAKTGYLPGGWDVLWSLSVEEVFYLFFPLLCLFIKNRTAFFIALLIFIIIGPFARCYFTTNEIWSDHSYLSCMDGIAFGCLSAILVHKFKNISHLLVTIGTLLFLFIFVFRKLAFQIGISKLGLNVTLLEISIGLILIASSNYYIPTKSNNYLITILQWFGKNSYEIYLTHMLIIIVMARLFFDLHIAAQMILLWCVLTFVFSGIIGHILSKYYSDPLNSLIRNNLDPLLNKKLNRETLYDTK